MKTNHVLCLSFLFSRRHAVPRLPLNLAWHDRGTNYIHVGVGITLSNRPHRPPIIEHYFSCYRDAWAMLWMRLYHLFVWTLFVFRVTYHMIPQFVTNIPNAMKAMEDRLRVPTTANDYRFPLPTLRTLYEEYVYRAAPSRVRGFPWKKDKKKKPQGKN